MERIADSGLNLVYTTMNFQNTAKPANDSVRYTIAKIQHAVI